MYAFVYLSRINFIIIFLNTILLILISANVRMFPETIAAIQLFHENNTFKNIFKWKTFILISNVLLFL